MPKNANKFSCERCDFQCSKESNYKRHLMTRKHKIRTNTNEKVPKNAGKYHYNYGKMLLGFLFYRFFNVNMNSVLNFYNFSMKNFCKYINFYSRPWRMIVSKLAKELYTNWGNKSYPYCFIYFHLFLFSFFLFFTK